MKLRKAHVAFAIAVVAIAVGVGVARTRVVRAWYDTVTVQGKVSMYLLDDRAAVDGLLLEGGQQIRVGARLGEAVARRIKTGDTVSVTGRAGRSSSFGRLVNASTLTVNGQTLTIAADPEGPRGRGGRGGRGPQDGPGGPGGPGGPRGPRGAGPRPGGPGEVGPPPPPPAGRGAQRGPVAPGEPTAPPAPGQSVAAPPPADAPARDDAPAAVPQAEPAARPDPATAPPTPPAAPETVTIRGTVAAYLVGPNGEAIGLALSSGEQVRFSPRAGEALTTQSAAAHPAVEVTGEAVRSGYGIIVRAAQLTVGSQTVLVR